LRGRGDEALMATIEDGDIVVRIPRLAIPYIAAEMAVALIGDDVVIPVGNISGLRDEIVARINDGRIVETMIGGIIFELIKGGTKNASAVRFPQGEPS
jgi:hypothetical protein